MMMCHFMTPTSLFLLSQAFQSHKADVLALCVDAAGTSVFTSGVDPAVAQFEFMPVSETSDWSIWVRTTVHSQHSHDVRALALTDTCLVSAGGFTANVAITFL